MQLSILFLEKEMFICDLVTINFQIKINRFKCLIKNVKQGYIIKLGFIDLDPYESLYNQINIARKSLDSTQKEMRLNVYIEKQLICI